MPQWLAGFIRVLNDFAQYICNEFYRNLIVEDRWLMILRGLGVTIQVTLLAILIGTVLGVILALMRLPKHSWAGRLMMRISTVYITVIRGTPLVLQLLIMYFVVFSSAPIDRVAVAIIAFGMNSGAYIAEIVRGGIMAVDAGQMEAGRSLGLNYFKTMLHIILPQAIKNCLPTYASEFIVLIKETAIVGYIAIEDLTKAGDIIRSRTYSGLFPLLVVALIYLAVTSVLAKVFTILERRVRESDKR